MSLYYKKMKVTYTQTKGFSDSEMTIGKSYLVIGIEANSYRIINDGNSPYLYDPSRFKVLDDNEPEFWINEFGEDGERYSYPISWSKPGFFEDYHDNIEEVQNIFWDDCLKLYNIKNKV